MPNATGVYQYVNYNLFNLDKTVPVPQSKRYFKRGNKRY